jgi:hypothetical protein
MVNCDCKTTARNVVKNSGIGNNYSAFAEGSTFQAGGLMFMEQRARRRPLGPERQVEPE